MSPLVKRYLIALNKHKLIGIASFALITGISGVFVLSQGPRSAALSIYKAQGVLAISTAPSILSETGVQINQQGTQLTKADLLTDQVLTAVTARSKVEPQELIEKVDLELPEEKEAQIIRIAYADSNRERAQTIVEVLMQKMIEQSRSVNTARLRSIQESIKERLPEAEEELKTAEKQLENYVRTEGTALLAAQDGTLVSAITGSQQQQRTIQQQIEGIETQLNSLVNRLGLTPDQAYTNSVLSADPIIANLRASILQTETQLELFSRSLRPEHPTMVELAKQKEAYEKLLKERADEVIGGNGVGEPLTPSKIRQDSNLDPARQQLANQLVNLQTQRDLLRNQLQVAQRTERELRQEYQNFPNKQLEQGRLEQDYQRKQAYYNKLEAALADAEAAEAETVSNLTVAAPPNVAAVELEENANSPLVILAGGAFFGLVVAGGLIFLLSTLDNTFYTPEEVREVLIEYDVPLLGELPSVTVLDPDLGKTGILSKPDSPYLESYEMFRSNLRRLGNQSLKVVLITSTLKGEGKTVSAYNLAIASAQAGKRTLLVEADLRSPSQTQFLKVTADPETSAEPLHYYSTISGAIRLAPLIENLYIAPSPGPQRQAVAILESGEFRQFLADARGRFDFVIIDTPALSRCNDALLLEPLTDGLVLVTRPGYTQEGILATAFEELTKEEPSPLLGVIINGVNRPVYVSEFDSMLTEYEPKDPSEQDNSEKGDDVTTRVTRF
ncbi:nucleotide-binding protein [Lyngbya aestuarii]|uniref:nucleotide-binding protein n=1 Tax=Lyngbya aestuarii TaxID=118322 RepID=UPI00403E304B